MKKNLISLMAIQTAMLHPNGDLAKLRTLDKNHKVLYGTYKHGTKTHKRTNK